MHALDALGSPTRRHILLALKARPLAVQDLAKKFPVSRPAISRHLGVLEKAGLVQASGKGRQHIYAVRIDGFGPVRDFLDGFWDAALIRLQELAKK